MVNIGGAVVEGVLKEVGEEVTPGGIVEGSGVQTLQPVMIDTKITPAQTIPARARMYCMAAFRITWDDIANRLMERPDPWESLRG